MARIIENWISSGIKTVSEAKELQEKYNAKKQKAHTPSYGDADDAFEAALARSYDDDEENDK
jgi:DNA replication protein DnaD